MKRTLLLICFLALCILTFPNNGKKTKAYEIKLSLNRPFLPYDEEPRFGFGLEAQKIWFSEKKLNLVSGIVLKNVNYYRDWFPRGQGSSVRDINYHAYYLSVPILLRYTLGDTVKFYIEAGPEFNCVPGVYYTATTTQDGVEVEVFDKWGGGQVFTLGLNTGAGFIVPIAGREYIIGSSYHNLLDSYYTRNNPHSHHFTIQLGTIIK